MMEACQGAQDWIVLVIEDEADNLALLEELLTYFGATVQTAYDGREGLAALARLRPTCVLLDITMPQMDGWETLQAIRANPATADLPVLALTAHAHPRDRERALVAGFNGYVVKPFTLETICRAISAAIQSAAPTVT